MKIGIIGGGQLGMMMAEEAKKLNHYIISLDPNPLASITKYSDEHIAKEYNDKEALKVMNDNCDIITYEFENVDLDILQNYIDKIPQKLKALQISRNRITEKKYANSLGIKTPKYIEVSNKSDIFYPSIIKTCTGGYDGKGQYKLMNNSEVDQVKNIGLHKYICEELINFDYEISVIATRDNHGNISLYPIPINKHVNGILHTSVVNGEIAESIELIAFEYTKTLIEDLNYVGTLAVEYFVVGDQVLFNEFAPRPHNSGHYTMDGCNVSQFKNHILAITNKTVIQPVLQMSTVMINVLGQYQYYFENTANIKNTYIHNYLKKSDRVNRKIGHINYLYRNSHDCDNFISMITKENTNAK